MKKILTSNIVENTRRQPFNKASLEHIQEAFQEVFADILKGLTNNSAGIVVLHGCVDSDPDATDWTISAGAALYNGEVYVIDAFTGSHATNVPVLSVETTYKAGDPVKFSDNNDFNVHEIKKLKWAMGVSGSGLADFDDVKRLTDVITPSNINAGGVVLKTLTVEIGSWNMDTFDTKTIDFSVLGITDFDQKIRSFDIVIRDDAGDNPSGMNDPVSGAVAINWFINTSIDPNTIEIRRVTGSSYDAAGYNDTVINRGWVTIQYVE